MAELKGVQVQPAEEEVAWHAISDIDEILRQLETSAKGLTTAEAESRLRKYGPNRLTPPPKPSFLMKLWLQINNTLVWVLIVSAIVTGALQQWPDMGLILAVVIINIAIGMFQEGKAEKAADAIKAMLSSTANVLRDGERVALDADAIVPGDVVAIKSGDRAPADLRLIQVTNLQIMEAMLTGESVPVSKNLAPVPEASGLGDRKCMVYSATTAMAGQGLGVVVTTGDNAEIGKINKMVSEVENVKTNLLIQMEILGRWLTIVVLIVSLLAFLLALLRSKQSFTEAFSSAVSIAVAIIPAGLPAIVTITLAIGTIVMANKNAIIRQLPCVESLGSLMVICSDKTGTLTKNEMTTVAVRTAASQFDVSGVGYAPTGGFSKNGTPLDTKEMAALRTLLEGTLLCNDSLLNEVPGKDGKTDYVPNGAPTEVALITAAMKAGINKAEIEAAKPRIASVPFESEHKFMATVHQEESERVIYMKGAPDRLMRICGSQVINDDLSQTAPYEQSYWQTAQAELSSKGLRVLAICRAVLPDSEDLSALSPKTLLSKQPFLSMVAMMAILDPPRDEAIQAVKIAHKAGITVKMITGDHSLTALAIGKMLGIEGNCKVYTGPEVDAMEDPELEGVVLDCNIFARASPENKLRIVRALQAKNQIAAMTGDGVNDAPALKAANIGVAMGITGTDVSKEAAKMVLADDNFATIVMAVEQGRRVWDNLRKILIFNLPVNFAQGCSILWSYILLFENVPMSTIQVLYVNMATAVTMGLMLAAEPPEPTVMDRPPRRHGKLLLGKLVLWRIIFVSTIMIALVLGMYDWALVQGYSLGQSRAEAFNVLVFSEITYSITCRFLKQTTFHPRTFKGNPWVYFSVTLTGGLQFFLTYTPGVNSFFSMEPMDGLQWARVAVCAVVVYIIVEIEKALVDPFLMPYIVRPTFNFVGKVVYSIPLFKRWLSVEGEEDHQMEIMHEDHPHHAHKMSLTNPRPPSLLPEKDLEAPHRHSFVRSGSKTGLAPPRSSGSGTKLAPKADEPKPEAPPAVTKDVDNVQDTSKEV